ncbi:hypothetical protein MY1884_001630 [Beauveria asiatica]
MCRDKTCPHAPPRITFTHLLALSSSSSSSTSRQRTSRPLAAAQTPDLITCHDCHDSNDTDLAPQAALNDTVHDDGITCQAEMRTPVYNGARQNVHLVPCFYYQIGRRPADLQASTAPIPTAPGCKLSHYTDTATESAFVDDGVNRH